MFGFIRDVLYIMFFTRHGNIGKDGKVKGATQDPHRGRYIRMQQQNDEIKASNSK